MKVMHIDSSARFSGSTSRKLSAQFIKELVRSDVPVDIDRLDLAVSPPQPFGEVQTAAIYLPETERSIKMVNAIQESDALCDRVLAADAIVCGVPMYNFGMPSVFKVFVDNISRSGKTFVAGEEGVTGLLEGRKAVFITASGYSYGPDGMMPEKDCLTPHLKTIMGFLGLSPDFIQPQPLLFAGPDAKDKAVADAEQAVSVLVKDWVRDWARDALVEVE